MSSRLRTDVPAVVVSEVPARRAATLVLISAWSLALLFKMSAIRRRLSSETAIKATSNFPLFFSRPFFERSVQKRSHSTNVNMQHKTKIRQCYIFTFLHNDVTWFRRGHDIDIPWP